MASGDVKAAKMDSSHGPAQDDGSLNAKDLRDQAFQEVPQKDTKERLDEEDFLKKVSSATVTILKAIGENPNREGLLKTPERQARAMLFITQGYHQTLEQVTNNAIFEQDSTDIVMVRDIEIFSTCEHHLLPFFGKMHIAYIPNGRVIGLSKEARIAQMYARRLQIQERLTQQVAKAIEKVLEPEGVAVVCECHHQCMSMRGVNQNRATTITQCKLGKFTEASAMAELNALLSLSQ